VSTTTRPPIRIAVLISGRGSNMMAIAQACSDGGISGRLSVVISDRDDAAGIAGARSMGIEAHVVARKAATDQDSFERVLRECIDAYQPELIVLAGFMRVLSAPFVQRYAGRMLNIHPSLLPKYRGLHTHRRAIEAGEREHGASVHFVTADLDAGPVVLQAKVPIEPGDSERSLAKRVQAAEHVIYPRVVGWFAQGRLQWRNEQPWLDGAPLAAPIVEEMSGNPNR
jgi:phosphoribosylglycinamide formyltransferase 1